MQRRLCGEIGRRLGQPDYQPHVVDDAIAHWIDQDCRRPPGQPIHDYRTQRTYSGPSYRKPRPRNEDARFTSAAWFALHRCGGDAMLHHRSLAPVITREWAEQNTLFESTIKATATVPVTRTQYAGHGNRSRAQRPAFRRPEPAPSGYLANITEPAP